MNLVVDERFECKEEIPKTADKPHRIFRALDRKTGEQCVVKLIAKKKIAETMGDGEVDLARFQRQLMNTALLESKVVVAPYICGYDAKIDQLYLAMPYIAGRTAASRAPYTEESEVLEIAAALAEGLEELAKLHLVHRNVTPHNLILDESGRPHIIGLSYIKDPDDPAKVSKIGAIVGSPGYRAPEQIEAGKIDFRCDMFGLGATLYFLFTGVPPFAGESDFDIDNNTLETDPRPANELRRERGIPDISPGTQKLLSKLLAREPDQRFDDYGSIRELCSKPEQAKKFRDSGDLLTDLIAVLYLSQDGSAVEDRLFLETLLKKYPKRWEHKAVQILCAEHGRLRRVPSTKLAEFLVARGEISAAEKYDLENAIANHLDNQVARMLAIIDDFSAKREIDAAFLTELGHGIQELWPRYAPKGAVYQRRTLVFALYGYDPEGKNGAKRRGALIYLFSLAEAGEMLKAAVSQKIIDTAAANRVMNGWQNSLLRGECRRISEVLAKAIGRSPDEVAQICKGRK